MKALEDQGHRGRLREKFVKHGFKGFHDYEILELILTLCIPRKDVKQLAKELLKEFGTIRNVLEADRERLEAMKGMGSVTPIALKIIQETASYYLQQRAEGQVVLNNSYRVEDFWKARLRNLKHEVFEIAFLDSNYALLPNGVERLDEGIVDRIYVYPRKVMESALKRFAAAIILAHNHPSTISHPSENDEILTKSIVEAGKYLNIKVVDHIIIAKNEVFSFRKSGILPR
jgi:DNA repair protein RadC